MAEEVFQKQEEFEEEKEKLKASEKKWDLNK